MGTLSEGERMQDHKEANAHLQSWGSLGGFFFFFFFFFPFKHEKELLKKAHIHDWAKTFLKNSKFTSRSNKMVVILATCLFKR